MADCNSPSPNCKRNKIEVPISKSINDVDDLLFQILIRLADSQSAIQCSLVCKRWYSLIFNPHFIPSFDEIKRSRTHHLPPRNTLLIQMGESFHVKSYLTTTTTACVVDRKPLSFFTGYLNFLPERGVVALASFKDLLLVCSGSLTENKVVNYYICNPLTRRWVLLPQPPQGASTIIPTRFGLSLEEEEKEKPYRILYKHKVLLVGYSIDSNRRAILTIAIFRSETGKWTTSTVESPCRMIGCGVDGEDIVSLKGVFHWLDGRRRYMPEFVVAFDPDRNACRFINFPRDFGRANSAYGIDAFLGVCRGRLRLTRVFERSHNEGEWKKVWKVWEQVINDDVNINNNNNHDQETISWSLVHHYSVKDRPGARICCYHPNNGDVVFLSEGNFGRVVRHNIPKGEQEVVLELVRGDEIIKYSPVDDDDEMISTAIYITSSKNHQTPTFFRLLNLFWPTPLPTLPST